MTTAKNAVQDNTTKNFVLLGSKYPKAVKQELIQAIDDLGYHILPADVGGFKSGERYCELFPKQKERFEQNKQDLVGSNVHIVMNVESDLNRTFVDAVNTIETVKEYDPASIHLVLAFAPYARQDRDFPNRMVSKMAKTFPKHLKAAGADYISTFDVHSKSAEAFYTQYFGEGHVNFVSATQVVYDAIKDVLPPGEVPVTGGPDGGNKPNDTAQRRAREFQALFGGGLFRMDKSHVSVNETKLDYFDGHVEDCVTVMPDDMSDTGGTTKKGATKLKEEGAKEVDAIVIHPILSGSSLKEMTADIVNGKPNPIDRLITTDSILSIYRKKNALPKYQQDKLIIVGTPPLIKQALAFNFN